MSGEELRAPEHLDDVGRLGEVGERRRHRHAEQRAAAQRGIHGQDAIAARGEVRGHVVRRLVDAGLGAEHGDRPDGVEDPREAGVVGHEVSLPVTHGSSSYNRSDQFPA